ncbi:MAG: hypothetical protein CMH65_05130 [Nevskiales bacterium]|nr:hypothetical protein [Nevskiales bacterium]
MPTGTVVLNLACRRLAGIRADLVLRAVGVTRYTAEGFRIVLNALVDISPSKFFARTACGCSFSTSVNFCGFVRLDLGVDLGIEHLLLLTPSGLASRASLEDHRISR